MDDMICFKADEPVKEFKSNTFWNVLVVDDDESVHAITKLVLNDFEFMSKKIKLIHAYSEKEAIEKIDELGEDLAVMLLDVVMATEKSGFVVAEYIRNIKRNTNTRIILRTGQPGQAPEREVVVRYDINDYKLKTELTADKLFITVFTGIRAFNDLHKLSIGKSNLRKILDASKEVHRKYTYKIFIEEILKQFKFFVQGDKENNEILGWIATEKDEQFLVEACVGSGSDTYLGKSLEDIASEETLELLKEVTKTGQISVKVNKFMAYFESHSRTKYFVYFENIDIEEKIEAEVLEVFCNNILSAIENFHLSEEISNTQKDIIYTLGEIVETKSNEVGFHIKRVSEYTRILAELYGEDPIEAEIIAVASTMHDIGKIVVDDSILKKPEKLLDSEFEIIKKHSDVGYNMLRNSTGKIVEYAAIIAHQHHEKYNGKGYPLGLKGEEINIYARMVAIADVFDALVSKRVYKEKWTIEDTIKEFKKERGEHFDPYLVDLFLTNLDRFLEVMEKYKD